MKRPAVTTTSELDALSGLHALILEVAAITKQMTMKRPAVATIPGPEVDALLLESAVIGQQRRLQARRDRLQGRVSVPGPRSPAEWDAFAAKLGLQRRHPDAAPPRDGAETGAVVENLENEKLSPSPALQHGEGR